jgi:hypothetical protein
MDDGGGVRVRRLAGVKAVAVVLLSLLAGILALLILVGALGGMFCLGEWGGEDFYLAL